MKEKNFGKKTESEYDVEIRGFPAEDEGTEVTREEFRRFVEEQKPKEVFARYHRMDDFDACGTFYIRLLDGSVIKVNDYYPLEDTDSNITKTSNPVSVLDNLPYKEILRKFNQNSLPLYFKAKYVLKDQTAA